MKNPFTKEMTVEQAQATFDDKAKALSEAQLALDAATQTLNTAHEIDDTIDVITKAEADEIVAKTDFDRALRSYGVAERRLKEVTESAKANVIAKHEKERDAILKERVTMAKKLDSIGESLAEVIESFSKTDQALHRLKNNGVVPRLARGTYGPSKTLGYIYLTLLKAGVAEAKQHFLMNVNAAKQSSVLEKVKYANDTIKLKDEKPMGVKANAETEEVEAAKPVTSEVESKPQPKNVIDVPNVATSLPVDHLSCVKKDPDAPSQLKDGVVETVSA